jgi:hypothetical protein
MPSRYGDDRFDDEDSLPSRGYETHPTNAGMIGFIAAMVAAGLLVVVVILYVFLQQEDQHQENLTRSRWMYCWFLMLDVFSFLAGLAATIFCGRGLAPTNPLYRGWAVVGLTFGIIEMIVTMLFGLFMTCVVLIAFSRPGG